MVKFFSKKTEVETETDQKVEPFLREGSGAFDEGNEKSTIELVDKKKSKKKAKINLNELKGEVETDDHKVSLDEVVDKYKSNIKTGLTSKEAKKRLEENGPNQLTPPKEVPEFLKLLKEFTGFFAILLEVGSLLSFIGYVIDSSDSSNLYIGIVLAAVVIITGVFSYFQNRKSSNIMKKFKNFLPQHARALRNGEVINILASEIVLGDIIDVEKGDAVPADIRIITSAGLKVDNSSLTGEAEPQSRIPECTNDNPLETKNIAFYGTNCQDGSARGLVIGTGDKTVIGRIAGLAIHTKESETPIHKEIDHFVKIISVIAITIGVLFFIISVSIKNPIIPSVVFMIGIIVANVPEGLLATVTVGLTLTANRMSKKSVLVKNLEAVETLGSTTVICSDKTGTLTQNRMTVAHLWFDGRIWSCDTTGGSSLNSFDRNSPTFKALHRVGSLCNRATFLPKDNDKPLLKRGTIGDASESAILKFVQPFRDCDEYRESNKKVSEIVFNSINKWQLSIHEVEKENRNLLVLKGAPERVLAKCTKILVEGHEHELTEEWKKKFLDAQETLGGYGERVLGFAHYNLDPKLFPVGFEFSTDNINFPSDDLIFVGLMALIDPPRPEVPDAVHKCKQAGIKVIMVTGDHPVTAASIARQVGIIDPNAKTIDDIAKEEGIPVERVDRNKATAAVIRGDQIPNLSEADWDWVLSKNNIVFARTSPQQKLVIVEHNQLRGEIVAVTGDGVNDSPALKKADIGVAMGIMGSDVSKETAKMILLDDNFASIVNGVEEGRIIFDNLKKSISYTLTSNIPEILPFLLFITIGLPLPLSTVLILCIDVGTDLWPAISLAYELPESDIMSRKPRTKEDRLVTFRLISFAYLQIGVMQALAAMFVYFIILSDYGFPPWVLMGQGFTWGRDDVVFAGRGGAFRKEVLAHAQCGYFIGIIVVQWSDLLISKTRKLSLFQHGMKNIWLNFGLIFETCLGALLLYFPWLNPLFGTRFIKAQHWLPAIPFFFFIMIYDETRKFLIRKTPGGWVERNTYW